MIKLVNIFFIILNFHIILGDNHCENYEYDIYPVLKCVECKEGYHLVDGKCEKNNCVEGEKENSCLSCSKDYDRCLSCYSDDYTVVDGYLCRKSFLNCGNGNIYYCESCEIENNKKTGNCQRCYNGYTLKENACKYNPSSVGGKNNCDGIKINIFFIYMISLFFFFG